MNILLLVSASLAVAGGGGVQEPVSAQEPVDWRVYIEEADWVFVGESEGLVSFARRHPTDATLVEFRYEYEDDQFARRVPRLVGALPVYANARSATAIAEIDCQGGRRRSREETIYPGRNLTGEPLLRRVEDRPWTAVELGTLGHQQMEWACSAA